MIGCFHSTNPMTYSMMPVRGTEFQMKENNTMAVINQNSILSTPENPFDANNFYFTVYATDTVTNKTSSFIASTYYDPLSLSVFETVPGLNADLQKRQRTVLDYFGYQMRVPSQFITYESCRRVIGLDLALVNGNECCTMQQVLGDTSDGDPAFKIVTCYIMPVVSLQTYDILFDVQAIAPGKTLACIGDTLINAEQQCMELFSYGIPVMNMIPDQYVAIGAGGTWELSLPVVINAERDYSYTLEFVTSSNITASAPETGFGQINLSGASEGVYQVNVIARAVLESGGLNPITKGQSFWVYVFNF